MPIDYTTPTGQVRLLIADLDEACLVLTDAQIGGYLALYGITDADSGPSWSIRRAAADALDAIAVSEALISKVIRTQDLQTDGAKVADTLRTSAAQLRRTADDDEEAGGGGLLGVVEFQPYQARAEATESPSWW